MPTFRLNSSTRERRSAWLAFFLATVALLAEGRPVAAQVCAFVANEADGTVSVIDTGTNTSPMTISTGSNPTDVTSADVGGGTVRVFVTNNGGNSVSVIDPITFDAQSITVAASPEHVAAGLDGKIFVSHTDSGTITVIDGAANQVTGTIDAGGPIGALAVTPDGQTLYAIDTSSNACRPPGLGCIVKIDVASGTAGDRYQVGHGPVDLAIEANGRPWVSGNPYVIIDPDTGMPDGVINLIGNSVPRGTTISPNGALALLCLTDPMAGGTVRLIPTRTNPGQPVAYTDVTIGETATPLDVAIVPDSSTAYATDSSGNRVVVVDITGEGSVAGDVPVGNNPQGIALSVCGLHPTPTPIAGGCPGDCNDNGQVAINELIIGVSIALGNASITACPSFDVNGNGQIAVNELIAAVNAALNGCPA